MSKINWYQAELEYISKPNLSYDDIAKTFSVAKSTVVRRAKAYDWQAMREKFQKKLHERALKLRLETAAQVDERQLKKIHIIQDLLGLEISKLVDKSTKQGPLSTKDLRNLLAVQSSYLKTVLFERRIKGLNTKPVQIRLTDPDDIDRYLETMGYKEPPPDRTYRQAKEAVDTLEQMIERQRTLQRYIDDVETQGTFNPK